MSSTEVDRNINAIIAPLATQFETLVQSVREISEGSLNCSTEGNVSSEQSRSPNPLSDMAIGVTRQPRSDFTTNTKLFEERLNQLRFNTRSSVGNAPYRRLHHMTPEDARDGEADNQMDQIMAAITDMPGSFNTTQTKTKLLRTQLPIFKRQQEKYNEFEQRFLNRVRPIRKSRFQTKRN